jgi:hypothetical protein
MSFGPKAPDPYAVAQAQAGFNKQAQQQSMIGQTTPTGSLSWVPDPSAPGGYRAVTALSPQQQQLLNLQQQGQAGAGSAAAGLGGQLAGLYGQPAALDPTALTNQMMDWQTKSIQPYWDIQKSNLEAQLQNQGLNPNDAAWQNAMMAFTKGIGQAQNQFFAQAEPLAFGQALTRRELPMQEFGALLGMGQPQFPQFQQTPGVQPPNYQGAAYQSWQDAMARNQAIWKDAGQLAGAAGGMFGGMPGGYVGGWGG